MILSCYLVKYYVEFTQTTSSYKFPLRIPPTKSHILGYTMSLPYCWWKITR